MAHPKRLLTVTTAASTTTNYNVSLPAADVDELLLAFIGGDSISGDSMSGWTKVGNASNGTQMLTVYGKPAVGGGADTGTVSGANVNRFAIATNVEGWGGSLVAGGASGDVRIATTTGINPPSVNPGASRDHLYVPFARSNNNSITTAPTNYEDFASVSILFAAVMAIASRQLTAQAEDPGTFNGTAASAVCGTLAVLPGNFGLVKPGQFLPFF